MSATRGQLFTIAAPSGAGKTSLVHRLLQTVNNLYLSISYTTRPARPGEVNGVDYHFVNEDTFKRMIEEGDFLEYANVFGNYYGTSNKWIGNELAQGKNVILEIDWQGVQQVKKLYPECVRIFILPPSLAVLKQRLESRGKDSEAVIAKRLALAKEEIAHHHESDFQLVNDEFDATLTELCHVINNMAYSFNYDKQYVIEIVQQLLKQPLSS